MIALTSEMDTLKARLKAIWMAGDYGHFAQYLEPGALQVFDRLNVQPGERLLDVACGAGQLSLPAARAGALVTGVDIAANLIAQARARAAAENLSIQFDEGDAEALPYPDESFDTVVSLIGAMFAPRPERVAAELVRVCRRGGRIVMVNWTPGHFVGQMFKLHSKHVPPPPNMPPPVLWGDEATVKGRLQAGLSELQLTRRLYPFKYPFGVPEVVEFYRTYYGPTQRAFAALAAEGQAALRRDLEELWLAYNGATDGTTYIESEYLEIRAIRQ
jgi:SAM-dependent methyltransferase